MNKCPTSTLVGPSCLARRWDLADQHRAIAGLQQSFDIGHVEELDAPVICLGGDVLPQIAVIATPTGAINDGKFGAVRHPNYGRLTVSLG